LVLAESAAIIEYLLKRHGNGRLVPTRRTNEHVRNFTRRRRTRTRKRLWSGCGPRRIVNRREKARAGGACAGLLWREVWRDPRAIPPMPTRICRYTKAQALMVTLSHRSRRPLEQIRSSIFALLGAAMDDLSSRRHRLAGTIDDGADW